MEGETEYQGRSGGPSTGRAVLAAFGAAAVLLSFATCVNQDPTAPEGSTVTVSANPQNVTSNGVIDGRTTITATVRGKNGTRLPDQELLFSTTQGNLTPPAQTPIITDSRGQAKSFLDTHANATVTATSGTITGTTVVSVARSPFQLVISLDSLDLTSCSDSVTITVTATDPNGDPVDNITLVFKQLDPPAGDNKLTGNFVPPQVKTGDVAAGFQPGEAETIFTPDSNCPKNCDTTFDPNAPNMGMCVVVLQASDGSGANTSQTETLTESIP